MYSDERQKKKGNSIGKLKQATRIQHDIMYSGGRAEITCFPQVSIKVESAEAAVKIYEKPFTLPLLTKQASDKASVQSEI